MCVQGNDVYSSGGTVDCTSNSASSCSDGSGTCSAVDCYGCACYSCTNCVLTPEPTPEPTPVPTSWLIDVTSPMDGIYWLWGEAYTITWESPSPGAAVDVSLYAGTAFELDIAFDVTTGSCSWAVVPR